MLYENNLQLTELQFYINKNARCLGKLDLISKRRQNIQLNTIIKCCTFLQVDYLFKKKTLNKPLSFREFYNTNPIFISNYVYIHKHTFRSYHVH